MTDDTDSDTTTGAQSDQSTGGENAATATAGDSGTVPESGVPDGGTAEEGVEQPQAGGSQPQEATSGGRSTGERLAWLVQVAGLVILCLLALVATFRVYFAASTAISVWISDDFVSLFQVAFNLLVLVASLYGISVLVRRLS